MLLQTLLRAFNRPNFRKSTIRVIDEGDANSELSYREDSGHVEDGSMATEKHYSQATKSNTNNNNNLSAKTVGRRLSNCPVCKKHPVYFYWGLQLMKSLQCYTPLKFVIKPKGPPTPKVSQSLAMAEFPVKSLTLFMWWRVFGLLTDLLFNRLSLSG